MIVNHLTKICDKCKKVNCNLTYNWWNQKNPKEGGSYCWDCYQEKITIENMLNLGLIKEIK